MPRRLRRHFGSASAHMVLLAGGMKMDIPDQVFTCSSGKQTLTVQRKDLPVCGVMSATNRTPLCREARFSRRQTFEKLSKMRLLVDACCRRVCTLLCSGKQATTARAEPRSQRRHFATVLPSSLRPSLSPITYCLEPFFCQLSDNVSENDLKFVSKKILFSPGYTLGEDNF